MLHPIVNITPIILPELCFKDRFNNMNLYVDMNPSLHISESGNVKILVRRVNYRKFHNRQFILYEHKSNSAYSLLTGSLDSNPLNLETFSLERVETKFSIPTYPTYWTGIEDVRFLNDASILTTIPECNPSGQPCIFRANIDGSTISSYSMCSPNKVEKNWMPYTDTNGTQKVIYSLFPLTIKSVTTDDRETLSQIPSLEGYHGSTNGIDYNGERLFLIHTNKERTYHRWMLFNPFTYGVKLSEPFVFFKHSHIEFTCSLASFRSRIFVSLGVNDSSAYILELSSKSVSDVLANVPEYPSTRP
jgi:hypothetical protein